MADAAPGGGAGVLLLPRDQAEQHRLRAQAESGVWNESSERKSEYFPKIKLNLFSLQPTIYGVGIDLIIFIKSLAEMALEVSFLRHLKTAQRKGGSDI